ncbi:MAG: type II toxin-antitoxin system HicB family antitoxin [Victivallales bacterium]|nr:type II toxin-antitoxin system HicB family antitoxin [Victivallales bacterium]
MKFTYCALIHQTDNELIVIFPDFNSCMTFGKDIQDATSMAEDALSLVIQTMLEKKIPLPKPTLDFRALLQMADKELPPVAFIMPVTVFVEAAHKVVHLNITCPAEKIDIIDEFAHKCGKKRSTFLVDSTMEKIANLKATAYH